MDLPKGLKYENVNVLYLYYVNQHRKIKCMDTAALFSSLWSYTYNIHTWWLFFCFRFFNPVPVSGREKVRIPSQRTLPMIYG